MPRRLIGLTGSLGSGKTTAATYLKTRGIPVFEADQVARRLLEPGSPLLPAVMAHFGPGILGDSGYLNRLALAEIIFRDPRERRWLEQQIHPQVRQQAEQFIAAHRDPVLVLDIPLLFEAGMTDLVNEIWVVVCSPEQQIQRLRQRQPQWSLEHIRDRLAQQWPLETKIKQANRILDNSGSREHLYQQIEYALAAPEAEQGPDQG